MKLHRKKTNLLNAVSIVFEDDFIIVVAKPANLLTIPDHWVKERPNLMDWLREIRPHESILVVHRLDLETSGLLVFAKSSAAHSNLCQQFEAHTIEKEYFAIVHGEVPEKAGAIDLSLSPNPKKRGTMLVNKNGKPAVTRWHLLEKFKNYSFLRVLPESGRLHQIRVHLRAVGHPLLVDRKYGDRTPVLLSQLKKNYIRKQEKEERPLMDRLALHAGKLRIRHPQTGNLVRFESELPKDMMITLKNLRKYRFRI